MQYKSALIRFAFFAATIGVKLYYEVKKKDPKSEESITRDEFLFGTQINLRAYGENPDSALGKGLQRLKELEDKFSVFKDISEVSIINKSSGVAFHKVSDDVFLIMEKALEYAKLTDGAFEPTIEPLVKLWGVGKEHFKIPKAEEILDTLRFVDYRDIELDKVEAAVRLKNKGQGINFGAIVKGYAADEVKSILLSNNIKSAFLDLGGNIFCVGSKPDGGPWRVGVQDPLKERGQHMGILSLTDKSVVTSGGYERYSLVEGRKYHHILDPKTGYPVKNGLISTTIVSEKSIDGDALTTAIYVMGLDKGFKLIESLTGMDAIFITEDKGVYLTSGIKEIFEITNQDYEIRVF